MRRIELSTFQSRFAGQTAWVIGRGPTSYRYEHLSNVAGPVFFINDAVSQERYLGKAQPSFFFAHDFSMACWLGQIRSVAVLAVDHSLSGPDRKGLLDGPDDPLLDRPGAVVLYWRQGLLEPASLLERSRDDISCARQLLVWTGTIHPLLHFVWFTGCTDVNLIGCDGMPNVGYDKRLPNLSQTRQIAAMFIRRDQDEVMTRLGLRRRYLGTPRHTVDFECAIRIRPQTGEEFAAAASRLIALARNMSGCLAADLRQSGQLVWQFRLLWRGTRALLDFLERPEVQQLHDAYGINSEIKVPLARALENESSLALRTTVQGRLMPARPK